MDWNVKNLHGIHEYVLCKICYAGINGAGAYPAKKTSWKSKDIKIIFKRTADLIINFKTVTIRNFLLLAALSLCLKNSKSNKRVFKN